MIEEELPQALPYLPPSQPPKPMMIESRMPSERPMPSAEHRKRQNANIARTWTIIVLGLLAGTAAIVWEMLF